MKVLRELSINQAWWVLCTVLPDGTLASDAVDRARRTGADYGADYHITYDGTIQLYTVILRVDTWLKVSINRQ